MKTGKSLVELATELESRRGQKLDFIVNAQQLAMTAYNVANGVELVVPNQGQYPIRPIAHEQIGSHLEIPKKYYDRMLAEDPELLANNVNRWLRDDTSKRMVRTLNSGARAFLSNRYQRIENEEIAEVALPILMSDPALQVVSCEVTERRLYIQATTRRITADVKVGDAVQAGVIISNSETGHGSVSVQRMVYRLRCLNGLILPDNKYRANHTGARLDDQDALWRDDTRKAEDKAILLKVRDMIASAMDEGFFLKQVAKMRETAEQKITGSVEKGVTILAQKIGATEGERSGILRSLIEGGDLSRWGVLNAVTHQAHGANDYDRSVEFEAMGSRVLDLSHKDWREVAEAA
jgi:hypothetical protein